jgi:hypothetical protein
MELFGYTQAVANHPETILFLAGVVRAPDPFWRLVAFRLLYR